ncbi:MAG: hypothetical protein MHM6MM_006929 [Cercozoa sp. M6MM]
MAEDVPSFRVDESLREYVLKMLAQVRGMKALVLDADTMPGVAATLSQTEALEQRVVLIERIETRLEIDEQNRVKLEEQQAKLSPGAHFAEEIDERDATVAHLDAVCLLRPTAENLQLLRRHLSRPPFRHYHVFFTNVLPKGYLNRLASADKHSVVQQVHEFYADLLPIDSRVFSLDMPNTHALLDTSMWSHDQVQAQFQRSLDALVALCLASKRKPIIRFQSSSRICRRLAEELTDLMQSESALFAMRNYSRRAELLIMDRREDPVTPLLTQWTYQAMVHELLGMSHQRVDLSHCKDAKMKEVVLPVRSSEDAFFARARHLDFGEIGARVKDLVQECAQRRQQHQSIESIEDIQAFVDDYPQLMAHNNTVSKHVALTSELSKQVRRRQLLRQSELEQQLACGHVRIDRNTALRAVKDIVLTRPDCSSLTRAEQEHLRVRSFEDKLRLVLLFALRFEQQAKHDDLPTLRAYLRDEAGDDETLRRRVDAVDALLRFAGRNARRGDLFGHEKSMLRKLGTSLKRGIRGVENVFTEHKPLLARTVEEAMQGALSTDEFPCQSGKVPQSAPGQLFVFMVGGTCFEEAEAVNTLTQQLAQTEVILGGTHLHNSRSFVDDLIAYSAASAPALDIRVHH